VPCYKAALWKNDIYYATRTNDDYFDDRKIVKAANPIMKQIDYDDFVEDITYDFLENGDIEHGL
jgi:hypothetical protein